MQGTKIKTRKWYKQQYCQSSERTVSRWFSVSPLYAVVRPVVAFISVERQPFMFEPQQCLSSEEKIIDEELMELRAGNSSNHSW